jgi:RNA polymerase sigma-70 factor, ECF subfamily
MNMNGMMNADNITERELIARAVAGDQSAYTALYNAHHTQTMSVLVRLTQRHEDAEDLLQQTFANAFHALPRFHGGSKFATWLHRIAVNQYLMKWRRIRPTEECAESVDDIGDVFGGRDAALESFVDREAVARCIALLPASQKRITILHAIHGYEHHEVADILGCTQGNCKSQFYKAKVKLRDMLQGEGERA